MKPGYKQTEVGIIPEEWEVNTVGQMITSGLIEKPLDGNHGNIHQGSVRTITPIGMCLAPSSVRTKLGQIRLARANQRTSSAKSISLLNGNAGRPARFARLPMG